MPQNEPGLSLEVRSQLIADAGAGLPAHVRSQAIQQEALKHLRAVAEQSSFYEPATAEARAWRA